MEYRQGISHLPEGRYAVTLGKFNGIHRGHQKLIRQVVQVSGQQGLQSVVVAFVTADKRILTSRERRELLERMGVDYFIECTLDKRFMKQSPEVFVREILVGQLMAAHIVVGPDFRYGYQRKGNTHLLEELGHSYGFTVDVLSKEREGKREISSTYVREQLNEGNMEMANRLLGYPFSATGEVLHGRGLGHKIGIPTTNLIPPSSKLMPPNGVYVTKSHFGNEIYGGITNVGYKPTVGGEEFLGVETYLFDCDRNLYGEKSKVEFYHYIRPERHFPSIDALVAQLEQDKQSGRNFLENMNLKKMSD